MFWVTEPNERVNDAVGRVGLEVYKAVLGQWALSAPIWTHDHPLRAFRVDCVSPALLQDGALEIYSIIPDWPTYPGCDGARVYDFPDPNADLDQKVSPNLAWKINNPHEIGILHKKFSLLDGAVSPETRVVHPNLPEFLIEDAHVSAALKHFEGLTEGFALVPERMFVLKALEGMIGRIPNQRIATVRPMLSQNIRLKGREPSEYRTQLLEHLMKLGDSTMMMFDMLPDSADASRVHFFGEIARLARTALHQNLK